MSVELLDAAGRPRSPATIPGYRRGFVPRNKGLRYPADPPRIEEIIAVMRTAGPAVHGHRVRALIVILWRAGLRINEALTLAETDLSRPAGRSSFVMAKAASAARSVWTNGVGSRSSHGVGTAPHFLSARSYASSAVRHAVGAGRRRGARAELRRLAAAAGVRRRFAPHQLRHAHAVEMAREGVPLPVIQRQLGHAHLDVTSTYLQGIDMTEIINTVHARRAPMIPASAGLRL